MAGIVFGCIVPHPPLIVPAVGGGREAEISATTKAMERITDELAQVRPELVFIISPHGTYYYDAMGVSTAPSSKGDFSMWASGGPEMVFPNDLTATDLLQKECSDAGIPLGSIGQQTYELDHGVTVPMYFLQNALPSVPVVPLTFSMLPLDVHLAFGKAIAAVANRSGKRVAVIASGDLSHRLTPDAPSGYHPQGKAFDEELVELVGKKNADGILNLDQALVENAGQCGLRSIVILFGALEGLEYSPKVLSYEGPFGVGYLVASMSVEPRAPAGGAEHDNALEVGHPLVNLAQKTVESYVRSGKVPDPSELTQEMRQQAGVFVSIKKLGELRGCIGTFEPTQENVAHEIIVNAISSATRDPRFHPIEEHELPQLSYSVDVLTQPEPVSGPEDLDPKRYGIIVQAGLRRGLLLPDLDGVNTIEEQLAIALAKAGISPDEDFELQRFEVKRYT
jgi:AmmeMemoRadiSam system protein A